MLPIHDAGQHRGDECAAHRDARDGQNVARVGWSRSGSEGAAYEGTGNTGGGDKVDAAEGAVQSEGVRQDTARDLIDFGANANSEASIETYRYQ